MNIDLLIKMTNEISAFFASTAPAPEAARAVATHLKRYWEPRMRAQMIAYYHQRQGAGLTDLAKASVALIAAEGQPGSGAAPAAGKKA